MRQAAIVDSMVRIGGWVFDGCSVVSGCRYVEGIAECLISRDMVDGTVTTDVVTRAERVIVLCCR